ncbi:MAG: glycosyltransferase family 2 protein [Clostridiales bacterium]|nr:glycosyltransferase family 2 protein [Clostridiales bacterium]
MTKRGVVILNYNDADTVFNLMEVISNYKAIDQIVIVDNCSTDDSYIRLKEFESDKCKVIESDKNGGYSYGNNIGLKYLVEECKCDYLFVANPDVSFEENVIDRIVECFEENKEYAVLSGVMTNVNGEVFRNAFIPMPTYKDDILNCTIITRLINKRIHKAKIDYSKKIMNVDIVPGSFFSIRANVLVEIGYLDEGTFLFCEERFLRARLNSKGYLSGIITDISYLHLHSVSLKKSVKEMQTLRYLQKAQLHYHTNYTKIKGFKMGFLKFMFKYAQFETYILHPIKTLVRKVAN